MKRTPLIAAFAFLVTTSLAGCSIFEGPEGPQGPPGVANIQTTTFTVNSSEFSSDVTGEAEVQVANEQLDILTSDIVNDGLVLAYTDAITDGRWMAMPVTFPVNSSQTVEYNYSYEENRLSLIVIATNTVDAATVFDKSRTKVVAVPPSAAENVDASSLSTYKDAVRVLGL